MKKLLSLVLTCSLIFTSCTASSNGILTRDLLEDSLALGTQFLLNNQLEQGNFTYEYNFLTQSSSDDDNQVRQAGALWGISLIHNFKPSEDTLDAVLKGFDFFEENSKITEDGAKYPLYPGEGSGKSGTVALIVLSLVELLNAEYELPDRAFYEDELDAYLDFLISLRKENGQFYGYFSHENGEGYGKPSPYVDGEALLAMSKAAKYSGYEELKPLIFESAKTMQRLNVDEALEEEPDSNTTKGYFQWGIMSYYELYTSGWEDTEHFASDSIELANWMIDVHKTLDRTRNTAYAYEGIISAYELANLTGEKKAANKFKSVIDEGIYKLSTWQVGSSIENIYIQNIATSDPMALGGVMNKKDEELLRIDVTQHQMHAVMLALSFVY